MLNKSFHTPLFLLTFSLFIYSCGNVTPAQNDKITVSILPVKYIINEISGNDFDIEVLVPPGVSPETYEPTISQLKNISEAKALFTVGLIDFEKEIAAKIASSTTTEVVDLSNDISVIEGDCAHDNHGRGIDPHIWISTPELLKMAKNAFDKISVLYPDSIKYLQNYRKLCEKINETDHYIANALNQSSHKYFIIYHPALTYYSRHYNIEQVSLEVDGKEPSAEYMKNVIAKAKLDGVNKVLIQKQFNRAVVDVIAKDIGAEIYEIDPLAENVLENLKEITDIVSGK